MKKILLVVMGLFLLYGNSHAGSSLSHEEIQELVTEIYVATFERAPALSGLEYWTNAVETGKFTIENVAQSFFDQPETQAKFPEGSSNSAFITTVYNNTLSRDPAQAGLAYWVDGLDRGLFRRDQAIMTIINGAKAQTGSATDAAMLAKKTEIGLLFAKSKIGDLTPNENFMDWAKNIIMSATDSNFSIDDAQAYIAAALPSELEADIESYLALISSVSDMSPMIDEISTLLEEILNGDSSVVTITPPMETLDISNLPSVINVSADFGAGYTPEGSSSTYTGLVVINITDIVMTETGLSANAAITATNVQRDSRLILNGAMTLGISLAASGEDAIIHANLNFSNLQSVDVSMNGRMEISMPFSDSSEQPIILTLTNFETSDMQASGTIIVRPVSSDIYDMDLDLTTHEGDVEGTARIDSTTSPQTIISTPSGPVTVGEYSVTFNNVIMNDEVCTETAASGNIVITGDSETKTITFNNCAYTVK
ncbi:DUF4214 domain-containing protein [Desulfobacter postgatei]|uniref:DUF4214 domain-containing protein n=1 Tax=Desulfobacter postgatei TaxID=2293 RepID=UPI00259B8B27|nr:DUF4214 domain-containing protein [uncultured Desulfobacter sp.]